jgi:hypothetical protein
VQLEGNKPAVTPSDPSDTNRVACPPGCLKSMANGSADPVATFTQWIEEACSHHNTLIGVSVEVLGSFAAALDGRHPQMPSVDFEDDDDDAADIAFIPPPPQLIPYGEAVMCIMGGEHQQVDTHDDKGVLDTIIVQPPPTAHFIRRGCRVSSGGGIYTADHYHSVG